MMRIKSHKLATAIYERAEKTLNSKKASDASAAISLYLQFYEKQDFGNNNSLILPFIKDFNKDHDCNKTQESQYKIINDSGLSKITEIYDALKPVIETIRTRKIIIIGLLFVFISIITSVSQYRSYNAHYEERNKKYNEKIEKLGKAEAILNAAEKISGSDSNSAYRVAGCISTYNSEADSLGLKKVEDFSYDALHREYFTGKVAEKTFASFESVKINLYAYVATEKRRIQPFTTYQIVKQTVWDNIIASLFQIIGYLGSLCSIFDFFGVNPFKRKKMKFS